MKIGTGILLIAIMAATMTTAFAQGAVVYKAKCQNCHGATGMADTSVGKALKVKSVTDPAVKKFTETMMIDATKNGMGKMQPYKGKLSDAQIKDAVTYFRKFIN